VESDELTQADLAEEDSVPVIKRIFTELQDGPKYPDELADALGVEVKTVKNRLSTLRKEGKIEDTGEKYKQARQVSLVSPTLRDGDGDTSSNIDLYHDPGPYTEG
jgi:biotin operon repressor